MTWVNITFKTLIEMEKLSGTTSWDIIHNLPEVKKANYAMDINKQKAIGISNYNKKGSIRILVSYDIIPKDTEMTFKFKYNN